MGTYYDPAWIACAMLGWKRSWKRKVEAMRAGLRSGMNLIDTAEIYQSEPLVREAIGGLKREDVFLATKVFSNHLGEDQVRKSLEKSLGRLGTTYVDLYQIHFPSRKVPIRETMSAMERLVGEGKVTHIGVSNFNLEQLEEAVAAMGSAKLASVQMNYSLLNRSIERDILPYCVRENVSILAYYPLAHGRLASKQQRVSELCRKYGATPAQLSLRWLADKPGVFPIPRASVESHVVEDAAIDRIELSADDADALERSFSSRA